MFYEHWDIFDPKKKTHPDQLTDLKQYKNLFQNLGFSNKGQRYWQIWETKWESSSIITTTTTIIHIICLVFIIASLNDDVTQTVYNLIKLRVEVIMNTYTVAVLWLDWKDIVSKNPGHVTPVLNLFWFYDFMAPIKSL